MTQLSMLDRTILSYAGVPAVEVANATRITVDDVCTTRERYGRQRTDGQPISVHLQQAHRHAQRARDLQRCKADADAQAAWGEAAFQVGLAIVDGLDELRRNLDVSA